MGEAQRIWPNFGNLHKKFTFGGCDKRLQKFSFRFPHSPSDEKLTIIKPPSCYKICWWRKRWFEFQTSPRDDFHLFNGSTRFFLNETREEERKWKKKHVKQRVAHNRHLFEFPLRFPFSVTKRWKCGGKVNAASPAKCLLPIKTDINSGFVFGLNNVLRRRTTMCNIRQGT